MKTTSQINQINLIKASIPELWVVREIQTFQVHLCSAEIAKEAAFFPLGCSSLEFLDLIAAAPFPSISPVTHLRRLQWGSLLK